MQEFKFAYDSLLVSVPRRAGNLARADREATEAGSELTKATERMRLQSLTAPVAGTVQDLTVHTLGGIVTPAQQLLRIVPTDGRIEVEAVVANQDVGFVELDQQAEIKIDTFPFTRYGLIPGHARAIARDAVDESVFWQVCTAPRIPCGHALRRSSRPTRRAVSRTGAGLHAGHRLGRAQ
jgi:multidrug efflux pump subunit AcrA (membrane-fusion protein)